MRLVLFVFCVLLFEVAAKNFVTDKERKLTLNPPHGLSKEKLTQWSFSDNVKCRQNSILLASSKPSEVDTGSMWSRNNIVSTKWTYEFEIALEGDHGESNRGFDYGNGFAIWITSDGGLPGAAYGSSTSWTGVGIICDTIKNTISVVEGTRGTAFIPYWEHPEKYPEAAKFLFHSELKAVNSNKVVLRVSYKAATSTLRIDNRYNNKITRLWSGKAAIPSELRFGLTAVCKNPKKVEEIALISCTFIEGYVEDMDNIPSGDNIEDDQLRLFYKSAILFQRTAQLAERALVPKPLTIVNNMKEIKNSLKEKLSATNKNTKAAIETISGASEAIRNLRLLYVKKTAKIGLSTMARSYAVGDTIMVGVVLVSTGLTLFFLLKSRNKNKYD